MTNEKVTCPKCGKTDTVVPDRSYGKPTGLLWCARGIGGCGNLYDPRPPLSLRDFDRQEAK